MKLENRIAGLASLGKFMEQFSSTPFHENTGVAHNQLFFDGFKHQVKLASESNGWFTPENLNYAFKVWSEQLEESNLLSWISDYNISDESQLTIAMIMAGNIPLVGFHDLICTLVCGHKALIKQSSNDIHLMPFLVKYLETMEPGFKGRISFTEGRLENYDAVLATGSNNTSRYFEYYFRDKPSIIRKNRNSVAVLSGQESAEQLKGLAEDVFRYYGLGCRNVSKIFVPNAYDFSQLFNAFYSWHEIINDQKYANNYDYNKAIYLMSEFDILENGFMMLKEDQSYASPIASLFYEYYDSPDQLREKLERDAGLVQCIVAKGFIDDEVEFGRTQSPELNAYADGIDTVDFLLRI